VSIMTVPITAGALVRRQLRRAFDAAEIPYTEDKGLIDSQFVARLTPGQYQQLSEWITTTRSAKEEGV